MNLTLTQYLKIYRMRAKEKFTLDNSDLLDQLEVELTLLDIKTYYNVVTLYKQAKLIFKQGEKQLGYLNIDTRNTRLCFVNTNSYCSHYLYSTAEVAEQIRQKVLNIEV